MQATPLEERFETKVKFAVNKCWVWQASFNQSGYGIIGYSGNTLAHRVAYTLYIGPIPEGLCVLHTCDNRLCVNPAHLFLGTNADNVSDRVQKGRTASTKGKQNGWSKLSDTDILEIQELIDEGLLTLAEIGERYGVVKSTVFRIKMGVRNVTHT